MLSLLLLVADLYLRVVVQVLNLRISQSCCAIIKIHAAKNSMISPRRFHQFCVKRYIKASCSVPVLQVTGSAQN